MSCILGIDVASRKLDLGWFENQKFQHCTIENSTEGIAEFLISHQEITATWTVGLESTGDYHLVASRFFLKAGFPVKLINPIVTKKYTRATIRGIKTDKTDAEIICRLIEEGNGDLLQLNRLNDQTKEALRLASGLKKVAGSLTLRLQSTERKTGKNLKEYSDKVETIIEELKTLSKEMVKDVTTVRSQEEELIDSIPGFAIYLSAVVHHELGDLSRFKNASSLVSFAGLDPRVKQSGERLNTTGRLMKRGSSHLRYALFVAANVARIYDPQLNEYYERKKKEGRKHVEVLCMISRKLLYRIWAVLKSKQPYEIREVKKKKMAS